MSEIEQNIVLKDFNAREALAFEKVYILFFRELYTYSSMLYANAPSTAEDVIHDTFIDLWMSKVQFDALYKVKAYIYVAIRNDFKNYIVRNKRLVAYYDTIDSGETMSVDVFEAEVYSVIDEALNILPADYARVIKLSLEGYKASEIAHKLNRTPQNVYNIKHEAISILKDKVDKNKLLFILFLLQ